MANASLEGGKAAGQILTKNEEGIEQENGEETKNDAGHVNEGFVGIDDERNTYDKEEFQRKGVRLSQRVRFCESAQIIPEYNGSPQSYRTTLSLPNGSHHNGFLPHGKEVYPLSSGEGEGNRKEQCSKTAICIVCLITGLFVSAGVVATMAAVFFTRGDFCSTSSGNHTSLYIGKIGLKLSTDGLFTKSYSKLLNRINYTNITVVQYVVQSGHTMSWIRPSNPVQILWNKGAAFKILFLSAAGEYKVIHLGDPMEDEQNSMSHVLHDEGWYAGVLPGGRGYVLLTVISEGKSWKPDQTKIIEETFRNNTTVLKLIKQFQ